MLSKYFLYSFLLVLSVSFFSCEANDGESKQKEKNQTQTNFLIILSAFRSEGNCIKTTKQSSAEVSVCNRKPRGVCNIGQSLLTQSEVTFQLSEMKKIADHSPDCQESILQSGLLSLKATTPEEEANNKNQISYQTVDSCEAAGYVLALSSQRYATYGELTFLSSAKGKIGSAAMKISSTILLPKTNRDVADSCLLREFTQQERELLGFIKDGIVIQEVEKR
ncbi:hypothetical protein [Leptospira sp. 'Mane']|uniref:hypothetical protein n=1 Tax=Leptospira sp. 'Mane' TaxID=3387407 RepID=UPI00398B3B46